MTRTKKINNSGGRNEKVKNILLQFLRDGNLWLEWEDGEELAQMLEGKR